MSELYCPYCQNPLVKFPQRKTKCINCENYYFVKYTPDDRIKKVVTESRAKEIDEIWRNYNEEKTRASLQSRYNVSISELENIIEELKIKFGKLPSNNDIEWKILNIKITQTQNLQELSAIYNRMARILNEENRDSFEYQKMSHLMELRNYAFVEIKSVKIYCDDNCPYSDILKKAVYPLDFAIKEIPIPTRKCTIEFDTDDNGKEKQIGFQFCKCRYDPIFDS